MQGQDEGMHQKPCIKLPEPAIAEDDIWRGELFGRAKYAATLREMLVDETEALVVAVNGKWGCGKSFFLQRFAREYEQPPTDGVCIYLNAWENDYLSNPLLFLYAGIDRAVSSRSKVFAIDPQALREAGKIAEQIWWNFARFATAGIVDNLNSRDNCHPDNLFARSVSLTEDFKKYLGRIVKSVRGKTHKPLMICVDELDRCRPSYAIETLERIKHLFNIPGIVFLLGIDREQLCRSITTVYGNIDTENYLHRFFDLEFVLPAPNREAFVDEICKDYGLGKYWKQLDAKKNTNLCWNGAAGFRQGFLLLAEGHQFELREIQTALKWFAVLARSQRAGFYFFPFLSIVLIVLRLRNRGLYDKYVHGVASPSEVLDFLFPRERVLEMMHKDIYACENIVATVYASMASRFEDNSYVNELQDIAKQCGEGQKVPESLPWVFRIHGADCIDNIIRLVERAKRYGEEQYNTEVLHLMIARLETFEWPDGR